jgi:26S proteasome regulatory subunit N8
MHCQRVTIAPLVLLSVVDHYKRLSTQRVVGVLLGSMNNTTIEVTNSFAVPFEEADDRYFVDTSYLQHMFDLYYKVNCKEKILGWYHSGPKLHSIDVQVTKTLSKYCKMPIIAVVNVHQETSDIPCQVYRLRRDGGLTHMSIQVGADETEEVGVEHLLRDIRRERAAV